MPFPFTASATLLAVLLYAGTAVFAGWARWRYGVKAPAIVGHPAFERAYRVQANTLEQMPIFLPSLWLAAICFADLTAATVGCAFIAFRIAYVPIYLRAPELRGLAYAPGALCLLVLWSLAVWGLATGGAFV